MQTPGASLNAGRPVVWRSCRKANPSGSEPRECRRAGVGRGVLELLLDAQQLVVLVDTLTTGGGARLDLPAVRGHGQIGEGGVLGLTGAMGHHGPEAGPMGERKSAV